MGNIAQSIIQFLLSLGIAGVFALAVLDSTFFFFLPFALDVIFILLVSNNRELLPLYIAVTVAGSLLGCFLTYTIVSRTTEATLEKKVAPKKLEKLNQKVSKNSLAAVMVTAMLPPPFPFTPFVIAAAIAKVPLKKLLGGVAAGRAIRYFLEGLLAIFYGKRIVRWLDNPVFQAFMLGLFVLAVVGSTYTVIKWLRGRRRTVPGAAEYGTGR